MQQENMGLDCIFGSWFGSFLLLIKVCQWFLFSFWKLIDRFMAFHFPFTYLFLWVFCCCLRLLISESIFLSGEKKNQNHGLFLEFLSTGLEVNLLTPIYFILSVDMTFYFSITITLHLVLWLSHVFDDIALVLILWYFFVAFLMIASLLTSSFS